MTPAEFSSQLAETAGRVLDALRQERALTAWELKVRLKISQSQLMLALGFLLKGGDIRMAPDNLTYKVLLEGSAAAAEAAQAQALK